MAYSGGLDSAICLQLLSKSTSYSGVTPVLVDVGQPREDIKKAIILAESLGFEVILLDKRVSFVTDFIFWAIRANARFGRYSLGTAMSRQLMAQVLLGICEEQNIQVIATGCTGKGNDIVRFKRVPKDLGTDLKVLAPVAEHGWRRRDLREMADGWGIPYEIGLSHDYNLWGHSIGSGELQSIGQVVPEEKFQWAIPTGNSVPPVKVRVDFHEGVPLAINGQADMVQAIGALNADAGRRSIGRFGHLESGINGIKSWEVYEAPGAEVLLELHSVLESATLDHHELQLKHHLDCQFSQLVYEGRWFHPLTTALRRFLSSQQQRVTGTVYATLQNGNIIIENVDSPNMLFNPVERSIE